MQGKADVAQLVERRLPKPTKGQSGTTSGDQYRQTNPAICRDNRGKTPTTAESTETWSAGRSRFVAASGIR